MNDTLKAVGNIGAELAAAKADLQREMERHRKTWRQLEQVRGLLGELREITSEYAWDVDLEARVDAALSQQAEPVEPAPAQDELIPRNRAIAEAFREGAEWQRTRPERVIDFDRALKLLDMAIENHGKWLKSDPFLRDLRALLTRPAQTEQQPTVKECLTVQPMAYAVFAANGNMACFSTQRDHPSLVALEADGHSVVSLAPIEQTEQQLVAVPEDFQPLETIRWWISAYTNPENGPSYQGHGMMVQMLCEYEALRIMLNAQSRGEQPAAYPHEAMDAIALSRYRAGASGRGPLHRYAVRAGDGEQELYRGSKSDCEHVARKLAGAFLDGGLAAIELYAAPIGQTDGVNWKAVAGEQKTIIEQLQAKLVAQTEQQPELTVWEGAMPESNGKSNFTAVLVRKGQSLIDGISDGMTIARSEYPDRVRYEADCVRYLIGELRQKPCITDYDADKHSGYAAPIAQTAISTQRGES